jgi:nitrogen fixation protein FixH
MTGPAASGRPITGRTVFIATVSFFAVVMAVNLVMIKFALETLPGTEVDSAYSASLSYGAQIKAAQAQAERQWHVNAHIERHADGQALVRVEARDRNGAPLVGLAFSGRLERPADKRGDKAIVLAEVEGGVYRGAVPDVAPGQWDLVLESDAKGERMFLSRNRVLLN